jgi:hypothetical protein
MCCKDCRYLLMFLNNENEQIQICCHVDSSVYLGHVEQDWDACDWFKPGGDSNE